MKRTELKRGTSELKRTELRRGGGPKRTGFTPVSKAQREKVARQGARVGDGCWCPVDPAHIIARALGGCDHEDCVIGLERHTHRMYDDGQLDVLPYLTLEEQAHAVSHVGLVRALEITTGQRWAPVEEAS